jgi:hypothetical protein
MTGFEPHLADARSPTPMPTHFLTLAFRGAAMPRQQSPSDELFARAAETRALGLTWESVAKEVNRAARTVRRWPIKYADQWAAALLRAERHLAAHADGESVLTLRKLLLSDDERIRWHAAKCLIARRIERDKIERKSPAVPPIPLTSDATRLIAFLDGHSDEELAAIVNLAQLPAAATD